MSLWHGGVKDIVRCACYCYRPVPVITEYSVGLKRVISTVRDSDGFIYIFDRGFEGAFSELFVPVSGSHTIPISLIERMNLRFKAGLLVVDVIVHSGVVCFV